MSREILFKAKRADNGEWVEGFYTLYANSRGLHPCILTGTEQGCVIPAFVIPETICEFTGLYDKNGKQIFLGDIVRVKGVEGDENWKDYDEIGKAVFVDGAFLIEVPKVYNGMKHYSKIHSYYMTTADWVTREVVGNRFDNPELLTAERIGEK